MILFTKEIEKKLQEQYKYGDDISKQNVIAKIFNPYGVGVWYIINQDPEDTDYLWAIVDWHDVEIGSVSKNELETIQVPPFGLPLERDKMFKEINAQELWKGVNEGKRYERGGAICEQPLSAKESAKIDEKLGISEHSKQKNEKIKKWIQTGMLDNESVRSMSKVAKHLGVSVGDIMHIKNNM